MAIVSITGTITVLGQLPAAGESFPLALAGSTAEDNGDGTWSITGHTAEENIPALTDLGCTVTVVVSDTDELTQWQAIDSQIDSGPGVA